MRGNEVNFICADDAHGTPIMLKAQQLGVSPEQMIGEMSQEHQTDFAGFDVLRQLPLDAQRREPQLSELIYGRLKENGFIKTAPSLSFTIRKRDVPAGPFREGTCRGVNHRISMAITAKCAARPTVRPS